MSDRDAPNRTITDKWGRSVTLPGVRVILTLAGGGRLESRLTLKPITIGTSPDCDLVLEDRRVSRRHCEIALTERGIVLRDLGSKNGTFLGSVRIVEAVLAPDAILTVGDAQLAIKEMDAASRLPLWPSKSFGPVLGESVVMRTLFARLDAGAKSTESILLAGEPSTGKELLARAIHQASPRKDGPFVVLDCSALDPTLLEAELFGSEQRTSESRPGVLELARGGTLFIDEIGELPRNLQSKLHRALRLRKARPAGSSTERPFDARIVAAHSGDLRLEMKADSFRADLYYQLATIEVFVPPLRERKQDIPLLVEHFLAEQSPPRSLSDLPPNALDLLMAHVWPGNLRELRNTVARLSLAPALGTGPIGVTDAVTGAWGGGGPILRLPLRQAREMIVEQFERGYIAAHLQACGGKTPALPSANRAGANQVGDAEALFRTGKELFEKNRYAEACPKLEESNRLVPGLGTRVLLALCYEKNGQVASAWSLYIALADDLARDDPTAASEALASAKALEPALPKLTIVVRSDASSLTGLDVRRNGVPLGPSMWNSGLPVDPGNHTVVARAPGKQTWQRTISIQKGERKSIIVEALQNLSMPPRRVGAIVAGATGVAGLIVGTIAGGLAIPQLDDAEEKCNAPPNDPTHCSVMGKELADANDLLDTARTTARISTGGFVVGGVGVAAAGILWFTSPPTGEDQPASGGISIAPAANPDGFGVVTRWKF